MNYQTSKPGGDAAVLTAAPPKRRGAQVARVTLLTLMVVGLAVWAADWSRNALLYVHETDARISADMVSISSRVAGWMVARNVGMGSEVAQGDVLAVVDTRDAQAHLVELEAEINRIEAERAELGAEIAMVDGQTRSRISSEIARLSAAQALVETIVYEFDYAERELARAQQLSESGVIPVKVLDEARTDYLTTQKELLRARALVATAEARVGEAKAARREITMLERERETLEYRKFEVQTRIERQKLDIADRTITSPINAVVSRAFVEVGEYVREGQRIALLHDPDAIYILTNIRETDIRKVYIGQDVRLEIDAYPDREFQGRVDMITHAATSEFALLPNPNPSGNFTKVTQRIPVRIAIDQQDGLLKPGMMVEVFIRVDSSD
ncbi:MAG: HlyD family secretion protein [Pseudomonadota bacterium]|nr:HlyD family secretion protein [Pseudomonadota bacterium]